jgi:hypothetical protein
MASSTIVEVVGQIGQKLLQFNKILTDEVDASILPLVVDWSVATAAASYGNAGIMASNCILDRSLVPKHEFKLLDNPQDPQAIR